MRLFQTGLEAGSNGIFDLIAGGVIQTSHPRGSWSTYYLGPGGGNPTAALPSAVTEVYFGSGIYYSGGLGTRRVWRFNTATGTQFSVAMEGTSSTLRVYRGNNSTLLATSGTIFSTATWYFVELHVTISATTGVIEMKVDGVSETLTFATGSSGNQNTKGASEANADRFDLLADGSSSNCELDDVYINDASGSQNNSWAGDIRIKAYIPNAAGDVTQLTRGGTDSGTNWGQVDERPPNTTDYVTSSTADQYDLYAVPNTSGVATVQAVTAWVRSLKSDAGARSVAVMLKSGSTEDQGADQTLSTSWTYYHELYDVDPTDSGAWSASKVDALQVGAKVR